jgi:PDZ domain-containing protein
LSERKKNAALQGLAVLLPLLVFLFSLPVFFFSFSPGTAEQVEKLIEVQGYQPLTDGQFYLTSVSVNDLSAATLALNALFSHDRVDTLRTMIGGERSFSDYNTRSDVLMELSKNTATAVALRQEGYDVGAQPAGVMVLAIASYAPIAQEAQVGDVIVALDGRVVINKDDIKPALADKADGQEVEVTVERKGERLTFTTRVIMSSADDPTPILGIISRDYIKYDFPIQVDISTEGLTGPSAGLMLTLGIINVMRGGGLAGSLRVAGTGEIFADGTVGPIGGINYKIVTAAQVGAQVFLAPEENYAEITDQPEGLRIYSVKNVQDALDIMQGLREEQNP